MFFNFSSIRERKVILPKSKQTSFNKIFVSKAEVKHTNSKAIITIYIYNKEKLVLLKKIRSLTTILVQLILVKGQLLQSLGVNTNNSEALVEQLFKNNTKRNKNNNNSLTYITRQIFSTIVSIRRSMLKLHLNKSKFEDKFLHRLSQLIGKYYGKKVEFNIVNIKDISNNADIFTEIFGSKVKKERGNVLKIMNLLLKRIKLRKEGNHMWQEDSPYNPLYLELMKRNIYKDTNISTQLNNTTLNNDGLNKILKDFYYIASENDNSVESTDENVQLRNIVLSKIKYKTLRGANLIVKGRLTKRYRADRALYKFKWKGGLKNVDSSFRKLRTVVYRGHLEINLEKSLFVSKRRVGSFATTGWLATK
jgi:hypothetical protein